MVPQKRMLLVGHRGARAANIPANRTSTVIAVGGSTYGQNLHSNVHTRLSLLAFTNNSLALPNGLEYIDDLDIATGGWEK